ncbi:MAG: PspA/IM30 family protein [Gammaproteobacteria bacterium]|nr:PspA/IM30 family protein [Gammaproteobacteria bacterium]
MSVFSKIFTAIKGGAREAGEAIVDANGVRIYEQEIRESKDNLAKAKQELTSIMAKKMGVDREIDRLNKDIAKYEEHGVAALNKGEDALAAEVAEKLADIENELNTQKGASEQLASHITRVKNLMKQSERKIAEHERELSMVKTTESMHKATKSISDNFGAGATKLVNAKESLERIKNRQRTFEDKMSAADQLESESGSASLDSKLAEAGITQGNSAKDDMLARLRQKAAK